MTSEIKISLYSTLACHLCEQAKAMLECVDQSGLTDGFVLDIDVIDIANDAHLFEQYGLRIPVVAFAGTEKELAWPFEFGQLLEFIQLAAGRHD